MMKKIIKPIPTPVDDSGTWTEVKRKDRKTRLRDRGVLLDTDHLDEWVNSFKNDGVWLRVSTKSPDIIEIHKFRPWADKRQLLYARFNINNHFFLKGVELEEEDNKIVRRRAAEIDDPVDINTLSTKMSKGIYCKTISGKVLEFHLDDKLGNNNMDTLKFDLDGFEIEGMDGDFVYIKLV